MKTRRSCRGFGQSIDSDEEYLEDEEFFDSSPEQSNTMLTKRKRISRDRDTNITEEEERAIQSAKQQCLFKNFKKSSAPCFLADDVLFIIFRYCSQEQILINSRVCRQWKKIAENSPHLWKSITSTDSKNFFSVLRWGLRRFGSTVEYINMTSIISGATRVSNRVYTIIAKYCKALQYLNLRGAKVLQASVLLDILTNNPNLQWLNISGCRNLTINCFQQIIDHSTKLTHLIVHHCYLAGIARDYISSSKKSKNALFE